MIENSDEFEDLAIGGGTLCCREVGLGGRDTSTNNGTSRLDRLNLRLQDFDSLLAVFLVTVSRLFCISDRVGVGEVVFQQRYTSLDQARAKRLFDETLGALQALVEVGYLLLAAGGRRQQLVEIFYLFVLCENVLRQQNGAENQHHHEKVRGAVPG